MNSKYLSSVLILSVLFTIISCSQQENELLQKIKQQPYWQLSEITEDGKKISIKFKMGFTLYNTNNLSGYFPVNSFGGEMQVLEDGTIRFGDVGVTSRGGERPRMDEETKLKKLVFEVNHAKFEGEALVMSNKQKKLEIKYTAIEFAFMTSLKAKTWKLKGSEQKQDTGVAVSYTNPNEQYANLKKSDSFEVTLSCTGEPQYDKKSSQLIYNISGQLGEHSYTGNLQVSKNDRGVSVANLTVKAKDGKKVSQQQQKLVDQLGQLTNFSYMHNNLHIDTKNNVELVFESKGK